MSRLTQRDITESVLFYLLYHPEVFKIFSQEMESVCKGGIDQRLTCTDLLLHFNIDNLTLYERTNKQIIITSFVCWVRILFFL